MQYLLPRVESRRWIVAGALVGVVVLAVSLALRQPGPAPSPRATSIDAILQQARVAVREPRDAGIHTLFARQRLSLYFLGENRTRTPWVAAEAVTWYEAPDRKRVEIEVAAERGWMGGAAAAWHAQTEVWDGTDHWTHNPGIGAVTVRHQEQRGSAFSFGGALGAALSPSATTDPPASHHCATPTMTGEGVVAGRDVWVVEFGRPRCGLALPGEDGRRLVWIDKATGLVLRGESYSADGRLYSSVEITHLTINGAIDPDRFHFLAPGDAVLRDYRGLTVNPAPLEPVALPRPLSLSEVGAMASFDVLMPSVVPRGFSLESVEHYWSSEHARALRSHADWVRLRYANAAGNWLVIEQGFGGLLALFAAGSPDSALQGVLHIKGATARWIDGNPTTGWESGVMTLLYIEGVRHGTGWAIGPGGETVIGSPFHVVLASNALTKDDLVVVAESVQ